MTATSSRRPFVLPLPASTTRVEGGPCAFCGGTIIARLESASRLCLSCGKAQPEAR